ncbi:hypothetical protein ES703_49070 [subsurface metagenome]
MKIDFNYQFITLDGEKIPERPDEEIVDKDGKKTTKKYPPFTLKKISENVLLMPDMDGTGKQKEMDGEEKCERYDLAMRIHKATAKDLADLQVEEIALLKKLIARGYSTLVVGQAFNILDPHGAAEKKAESQEKPESHGTSEEKSGKDN